MISNRSKQEKGKLAICKSRSRTEDSRNSCSWLPWTCPGDMVVRMTAIPRKKSLRRSSSSSKCRSLPRRPILFAKLMMCLHSFPLKKFGISGTKKEVLNLVGRFNCCRIIIIYFLTISDGFFDWSRTSLLYGLLRTVQNRLQRG